MLQILQFLKCKKKSNLIRSHDLDSGIKVALDHLISYGQGHGQRHGPFGLTTSLDKRSHHGHGPEPSGH